MPFQVPLLNQVTAQPPLLRLLSKENNRQILPALIVRLTAPILQQITAVSKPVKIQPPLMTQVPALVVPQKLVLQQVRLPKMELTVQILNHLIKPS